MVITLDRLKKPLGFCTERRARRLMDAGRACIYRHYPFTVIIKDADVRMMESLPEYRIKIDPGSIHTGISVIREDTEEVVLFLQISHRGAAVVSGLLTRSTARRNRRQRETVYRRCKFRNGQAETSRPDGWIPPSVKSIGDNILHVVRKLCRMINIPYCSFEAVRFDTQLLDNPEISGKEYQHGTLFGYELREYLLEKYGHVCQYCRGTSEDPVLEWEHKIPKSRGGSDSVKNAMLSCRSCNRDKGNRTPEEWAASIAGRGRKTKLDTARLEGISNVMAGKTQKDKRYAAWVSVLRRYLEKGLFGMFGTVECSSGGKTKYNREKLGLPKDHHFDALCVGDVPESGYKDLTNGYVMYIEAVGRGNRFRGKINRCGVITNKLGPRAKRIFGFMNGDIVAADPPKGKFAGHHVGRVMTRASGSFDIRTQNGSLVTVNKKYCRILQYGDGYKYRTEMPVPLGN